MAGKNKGYRSKQFAIAVIILVTIAGLEWFFNKKGDGPENGLSEPTSIAVLPFANLTNDPGRDYFASGLAQELLDRLAEVPGLRVTSSSSSFAFKGQEIENVEIAHRLGVAHVLEGSAITAGNRVRITVRLVEAKTGFRLWSESFEEKTSQIFHIHDQILSGILSELGGELLADNAVSLPDKRPDFEAYDAYLKGRYLLGTGTWVDTVIAISHLERCIKLDPSFAKGHAVLASALYELRNQPGLLDLNESEEVLAQMSPHVHDALKLDANDPLALALRGQLLEIKGNNRGALGSYDRALAINPGMIQAINWRARLLIDKMARPGDAMDDLKLSVTIDPLSTMTRFNYALNLTRLGRYEKALAVYQKLSEMDALLGNLGMANIYFQTGRAKDAIIQLLRSIEAGVSHQVQTRLLSGYLLAIGLPEEARKFDLVGDGWIEAYTGQGEAAIEKAWALVASNPGVASWQNNLLLVALVARDFKLAAFEADIIWELAGAEVSYRGLFTLNRAAFAARAYEGIGKAGETATFIEPALVEMARVRAGGVRSASEQLNFVLLLVAAGKLDEGMVLLDGLVRSGFIENIIWNSPVFDLVALDLRYQDSVQIARAQAARQMTKLLELYCGVTPPTANWQPEQSSCDALVDLRG